MKNDPFNQQLSLSGDWFQIFLHFRNTGLEIWDTGRFSPLVAIYANVFMQKYTSKTAASKSCTLKTVPVSRDVWVKKSLIFPVTEFVTLFQSISGTEQRFGLYLKFKKGEINCVCSV